jgi:hypothetical protein
MSDNIVTEIFSHELPATQWDPAKRHYLSRYLRDILMVGNGFLRAWHGCWRINISFAKTLFQWHNIAHSRGSSPYRTGTDRNQNVTILR